MTRVDVVIPCYNYGRYLQQCVDSVLGEQPGIDVRVLIIDDSSMDNSDVVGRRLASTDSRVEYRRHATNHGHIATYNEGLLGWASGEYCLLISADDLLTHGALARAIRVLDAHLEVGLCYGRQFVFSNHVPMVPMTPHAAARETYYTGQQYWDISCRTGQNLVPTPTAVVRTAVQHKVGGYRKELPHTGDLEIWLRIAAHAGVVALDVDQAFKRIHGCNMQTQYVGNRLKELHHRRLAFESALASCAGLTGPAGVFKRQFRRTLALEALWVGSAAFDARDLEGCRQCIEVATELDPNIRKHPLWVRLVMKRAVGPRAWLFLGPVWRRVRGCLSAQRL